MKILMTAFEPFGGDGINASLEALQRLTPPEGAELVRLEVPTVFALAGERVLQAVKKGRPDVVICLGQAAGRAAVTPERVAINVRDAAIPDNAGNRPCDELIVPGGPAAFFSTLPIREMTRAAKDAGFAAELSNSAGTFVCNDLMYLLLYALERDYPDVRGGFIHVPACAAPASSPTLPTMPPEETAAALDAMLRALR